MTSGLLDRLARRARGQREDTAEQAVLAHLRLLLNTRQGSSAIDPSYGVPDFTDVVHNVPNSLPTLQRMITDAIKRSEPRLTRVSVTPSLHDKSAFVLRFEVRAQLVRGGQLRFETEISGNGHVRLGN